MTADGGWEWPVLHEGQRLVLAELVVHGARSRADLARRAGLSRTSLTRLARDLQGFGFLRESGPERAGSRGRPGEVLDVDARAAHIIGVKLTGDALYAVVCDLRAQIVAECEVALTRRSVVEVIEVIASTVARLRSASPRVAAVGVCLAGDVASGPDGRDVVVGSNFLRWDEVPLQELIEEATGLPAAISNDVQALTSALHLFGPGATVDTMAVIGYGEGIGTGLVVGGQLIRGVHGRPGKVGHVHVGGWGAVCERCGRDCVAALALIPRILASSGHADLGAVLAAAESGDTRSATALDGAGEALGAVVAEITNLLDPGLVVITGEGVEVARHRSARLETAARARLDPTAILPEISLVDFRFEDYARGAAVCALRLLVL